MFDIRNISCSSYLFLNETINFFYYTRINLNAIQCLNIYTTRTGDENMILADGLYRKTKRYHYFVLGKISII